MKPQERHELLIRIDERTQKILDIQKDQAKRNKFVIKSIVCLFLMILSLHAHQADILIKAISKVAMANPL